MKHGFNSKKKNLNVSLSATVISYNSFHLRIPVSFFSSVEKFVNKVNDWLIKTNRFPIGEFIFVPNNDR